MAADAGVNAGWPCRIVSYRTNSSASRTPRRFSGADEIVLHLLAGRTRAVPAPAATASSTLPRASAVWRRFAREVPVRRSRHQRFDWGSRMESRSLRRAVVAGGEQGAGEVAPAVRRRAMRIRRPLPVGEGVRVQVERMQRAAQQA